MNSNFEHETTAWCTREQLQIKHHIRENQQLLRSELFACLQLKKIRNTHYVIYKEKQGKAVFSLLGLGEVTFLKIPDPYHYFPT